MNPKKQKCFKLTCVSLFLALCVFPFLSFGEEVSQIQTAEEGLETLLFQEVPMALGSLTQQDAQKSPVSTTIIDQECIKMAPVRNLYDLLEMFVPGFQYLTHLDSSHMGLRGLIVDRDYTFLLLVNGRLANQKSHDGVVTEMENWDLSDIEKVEVIRGPGSVTYGPGAVAGVISITTKNPSVAPTGTEVGVSYVSEYDSKGIHVSHSAAGENYGFYAYGSMTRTEGYDDPEYFAYAPPSREAHYVEPAVRTGQAYVSPVQDYYSDYKDDPQVKLYAELDFFKEFKIWARYLNSGTTRIAAWTNNVGDSLWQYKRLNAEGEWDSTPCTGVKQYIFATENNHNFSDDLSLKSTLSYSSIDQERTDNSVFGKGHYVENYAETGLLFKTTLNYGITETLKSALGFEYAYDELGQGWGDDDKDEFIMDDGVIFVSRPGSPALEARNWVGTDQQIYLTSYHMYNYAFLAELNKSFTPQLDVMLSGRMDKYELSDMSFSPRLSVIYSCENSDVYKFNMQRSVRENTLIQMASADYYGNETPDQEIFDGMEFIYSKKITPQTNVETSLFYSKADLLGWNSRFDQDAGVTSKVGSLTVGGIELTLEHKTEDSKYLVGLNHSYSKQLDFSLASGETGSYISRSDSNNTDYEGVRRDSIGSDRMNWANNITKFYTNIKLTEKLTVFNSTRIIWGYEGDKNWIRMYERGSTGTAVEERTKANTAAMKDEDLFEMDFRFDLSAAYKLLDNWTVTLYGQNLIKLTDNWRYSYIQEGGVAVKEPTTVGIKSDYRF